MDPNISTAGNVVLPFAFCLIACVFAWVQSDLGVIHIWFKSVYRDRYPRANWIFGEGAGWLTALVFLVWGLVNLWRTFVMPYLGNAVAQATLFALLLAVGALVITTDFRFGRVWITFRLGWPCPVWRDQSPGWFWFWELVQIAVFGAVLSSALATLF